MEYFMQIFQQYLKGYWGYRGSHGYNYNYRQQQYSSGYNQGYNQNRRTEGRPHRGTYPHSNYGYQNQSFMYGRTPRQEVHHSYATASSTLPHSVSPPVAPDHMINQMPSAPLSTQPRPPVNAQPSINANTVKIIFTSAEFSSFFEEARREKIGEEIYNYIL